MRATFLKYDDFIAEKSGSHYNGSIHSHPKSQNV